MLAQEAAKEHDSCTNNLYNGLKELGMELTEDPRYSPTPSMTLANVAREHAHTLRRTWSMVEGIPRQASPVPPGHAPAVMHAIAVFLSLHVLNILCSTARVEIGRLLVSTPG